ncbi:hypothetical protein BIFLH23_01261 [Bifidobacterium longum subsp. infantis]|uniref:Uncharacterized protein n=1 Tax=Bifidobacterium longum subsp. infantis TaxID=1682 RepID=A0A8U0LFH9_BIFLI|nr:hypothetical protein BIFLH23_01261 [Bifidobacterium longum subsp. infantis]
MPRKSVTTAVRVGTLYSPDEMPSKPITSTSPGTFTPVGAAPTVEALPTGTNAAVTVVPSSDEARVIVTSEDGTNTRVYHINFSENSK